MSVNKTINELEPFIVTYVWKDESGESEHSSPILYGEKEARKEMKALKSEGMKEVAVYRIFMAKVLLEE